MDDTTRSGAPPARLRPHRYVAAAGLGLVALYAVGEFGFLDTYLFVFLAFATAIGTLVGFRLSRPRPRWPWMTWFAAMVLFLVGGALREQYQTLGNLTDSRSLLPDLVTLPGYAVLAAGMAGFVKARTKGRSRAHQVDIVLDASLAALATLALAWTFLLSRPEARARIEVAPVSVQALLVAYPVMSAFLVAVGVRIAFIQGKGAPAALRLIAVALGTMLVGDVVYMLLEIDPVTGSEARLADLPYALAYVTFLVTVLHPSMRVAMQPAPIDDEARPSTRLALVTLALCVPAVLTVAGDTGSSSRRVAFPVIVLGMTGIAALRMYRALREHAQSEQRLAYQATHDQLTGLPNRDLIQQRLGQLVVSDENVVALLFLDIDRFKLVNDTMGHSTGDELLRAVARRLQATMRPRDLVGRGGGDEFLVVVRNVRDAAHALEIAERTRLSFATPFRLRDAEIALSVSVGVAVQIPPESRSSAETMFRDADTAMFQAKAAGGDATALFDSSVRARLAERVRLERELRHALERQELDVHFQPVVTAADGRVCGMEALLRWTHPWLGNVRPDVFIPVAEDSGLIVDIGAWVLDQACAEVAHLRGLFPRSDHLYVAVNLSARQLRDDQLLDVVATTLERHHLPPHALCLELTESLLMENVERTAHLLTSLRTAGVRISIDDFGTGYSSLAYLKRLPVDEVKIDRSFVTDIVASGSDTSLVSAVVAIAESFGMSTVAEGVEQAEQTARLVELGCDKAQGYVFSRPVPSLELPSAISRLGLAEADNRGIAQPA